MTVINRIKEENYGYIQPEDLPEVLAVDRLTPLLVRCGGCRFVCPAQDLEFLLEAISKAGDYVRDVSLKQ